MKWVEYAHIDRDTKDNDYVIGRLEEYAKEKGKTMEMVVKETLLRWIDGGLFTTEQIPLFFSADHNTWNGNTKLTHKEIFSIWYGELQKTKILIDKLVIRNARLILLRITLPLMSRIN